MSGYVGAQHEFHNAEFVRGWANRFVPTPERLQLFDMILDRIRQPDVPNRHVVELGIGPGYMARHILESEPDRHLRRPRFLRGLFRDRPRNGRRFVPRLTLTKADLMDQDWPRKLSKTPGAIISTWALHDLGSQQAVADVYARCHETLPAGGVLVNGDFIKPDGTTWEYEPGRFEIDRHFELLRKAGFSNPRCLAHLEPNIQDPTGSENYACLVAVR